MVTAAAVLLDPTSVTVTTARQLLARTRRLGTAGGKLIGIAWGSDLVDGPYCYTKVATFKAAIDAEVARS